MDLKSIGKKVGKLLVLGLSSLSASLILGSVTLAAPAPVLNVSVIPIANKGLEVVSGNEVTYFYAITNSGSTPIGKIDITDDKCTLVSYDAIGQDLNVDHMLDQGETWSYFCTMILTGNTTSNVLVTGDLKGTPIIVSTTRTVIVPAGSGANGGQGGAGGIPRGLPNTGLGGGAKTHSVKVKKVSTSIRQNHQVGFPEKLAIPRLGVQAEVQEVGLASNGSMAAPQAASNVGWYKFGPQPGQAGNAVFAGHVDTYTSNNGVFKGLNQLKTGDDIYVSGIQGGTSLHFKVNHSATYSDANAPMQTIFGASSKAHLNLITCSGEWDSRKHQYAERLVVFTDLQ